MKKSFLATMVVACALAIPSYDVMARGGSPSAPSPRPAAPKAAPPAPKPAPPPVAKAPAPAPKTIESGPVARGAPPPVAKAPAEPPPSAKPAVAPPPSAGVAAAPGKPAFDAGAAQALKAQEQQKVIKQAEDDRAALAARNAQAKREADAAIARAQESSRRGTNPPIAAVPAPSTQNVADAERIRRLEQSNRDLRDSNRYLRRDRADAREAALRAQYHWGSPYAFRTSYSDIFVGSMIWSMWANWNAQEQARWLYHHQYQMDQNRYQELLNSNYQLRAEVQQLERQQMMRDINYVPPQLRGNEDLMYAQNAAAIAQRQAAQAQTELADARARAESQQGLGTPAPLPPVIVAAPPAPLPQVAPPAKEGGSHWFLWTLLILAAVGGVVWWLRQPVKEAK